VTLKMMMMVTVFVTLITVMIMNRSCKSPGVRVLAQSRSLPFEGDSVSRHVLLLDCTLSLPSSHVWLLCNLIYNENFACTLLCTFHWKNLEFLSSQVTASEVTTMRRYRNVCIIIISTQCMSHSESWSRSPTKNKDSLIMMMMMRLRSWLQWWWL